MASLKYTDSIMETFFQSCGYFGGSLAAIRMLPQVLQTYKTKSADDVSYGMLILTIIGHTFGLIYSIGLNVKPVYVPMIPNVLLTITVLVMKMLYARKQYDFIKLETMDI